MEVPTPERRRVSNRTASLLGGSSRRRLVIVFDRVKFLELTHSGDLLEEISQCVADVVSGVVQIQNDGTTYDARVLVSVDEGWLPILRNTARAVAHGDDKKLLWHGRPLEARAWGPYPGMRRRGIQARNRFQKTVALSNERMNRLVEVMWRMSSLAQDLSEDEGDSTG